MASRIPAERWHLVCNGAVTSPTRLMGEASIYRDHRVRILKEIANETGMQDNRIRRKAENELDVIGRDREVNRDGVRDKMTSRLLGREKWTYLSTQPPLSFGSWKRRPRKIGGNKASRLKGIE